MARQNPLKLNKLQARTLVLAQVIARQNDGAIRDAATGDAVLTRIPRPHGDHVHVGPFVVSAKDASGFSNPSVWAALARKGLARTADPQRPALTPEGQSYDTGLGDRFLSKSDH